MRKQCLAMPIVSMIGMGNHIFDNTIGLAGSRPPKYLYRGFSMSFDEALGQSGEVHIDQLFLAP